MLALVADDVDWPDGDARLGGNAAVERNWREQWTRTHTRDEPVRYVDASRDVVVVHIGQSVEDLSGRVLCLGAFEHSFGLTEGRTGRLDITARPQDQ